RDPVSWQLFYRQVVDALSMGDVLPSLIKSFFFGFILGAVGCYKGFTTAKGTEGVGQSAHGAVVMASLLIFIIDLLAVQITDIMGLN
ncbi:MAG: ABC transporter permease, partial [Flavobacteriales bacterium]